MKGRFSWLCSNQIMSWLVEVSKHLPSLSPASKLAKWCESSRLHLWLHHSFFFSQSLPPDHELWIIQATLQDILTLDLLWIYIISVFKGDESRIWTSWEKAHNPGQNVHVHTRTKQKKRQANAGEINWGVSSLQWGMRRRGERGEKTRQQEGTKAITSEVI